jgi:hypothetical protein
MRRDLPKDYVKPFGLVGFLLPKSCIERIETKEENGFMYQTISFPELTFPREEVELFRPEKLGTKALNIKGMGQIAGSAFICGQMRQSLKTAYSWLQTQKPASLESPLVQSILADVTTKMYTVESALYLTSAMFDAFSDERGYLKHVEATVTKTITTESALDVYHSLQSIFGMKPMVSPSLMDNVRVMDSFMEGSVHGRIHVGLNGARIVGAYKNDHVHKVRLMPFFPSYYFIDYIKSRLNRKDKPRLDLDLKTYLPTSFMNDANLLEYTVKRMEWGAEMALSRWGKQIPEKQIDINRLSQLALEAYKMTAVLSRASKAISSQSPDMISDQHVARNVVHNSWRVSRDIVFDLENAPYYPNDERSRKIDERNTLYGGYFAYSPLDKVHY